MLLEAVFTCQMLRWLHDQWRYIANNVAAREAYKCPVLQVLERLEEKGWVDEILVSANTVQDWFDSLVVEITMAIARSMSRVKAIGKQVDYLLIVGGFGGSPHLISKLRQRFSSEVKEVVCPGVPSQAVLKGETWQHKMIRQKWILSCNRGDSDWCNFPLHRNHSCIQHGFTGLSWQLPNCLHLASPTATCCSNLYA